MSILSAKPEHEVAYQDLMALLNKHADHVTPLELLAIASNAVGKIIALQDQTAVTADQAMQIVARNIEVGNQQVLDRMMQSAGSA